MFTLTASPAPDAPLAVEVAVSQDGDFGAATGARTVTIPTGGGTVDMPGATADDDADEPDGSVTVTLAAGSGYTLCAYYWRSTPSFATGSSWSATRPSR